MQSMDPTGKHIVLVGGGHTHALVLEKIAGTRLSGATLTLINPGSKAPYTGMLPGYVAGHYQRRDVEIDLIRLARRAGARIILDQVTGISPDKKTISLAKRPRLGFDIASINVGITSHLPDLPGFQRYGCPAKPLGHFANGWHSFTARILETKKPLPITVIGGGIAGVELALTMSHRILSISGARPKITVIEQSNTLMRGTHERTRAYLTAALRKAGIACLTEKTVLEVEQSAVILRNGEHIASEFTVGAAGATPHDWIALSTLATHDGFIEVDETLASKSHPDLFSCGDCAHFSSEPLPKAGVYAVRQAPILHSNLVAAITGAPKKRFRPQKNFLKLVSTGPKAAVADWFGLPLSGPMVWAWKDRIDRSFMKKLTRMPKMARQPGSMDRPATPMLCGGCGAKVAKDSLTRALDRLDKPHQPHVINNPRDDAAVLRHPNGFQVLSLDHLRAFSEDPWLMGKVSAVHALGDIWAMGAEPQTALAAFILPNAPAQLQQDMLTHILDGAKSVFATAGADIIGGHTSVGAELTVGFSLTGFRSSPPITNAGAQPGDVLVLTKPLGVGTILAAEMQGRADGYDVEEAYAQMATPVGGASALLKTVAAAMTDVTGFGLAGHLETMMHASQACAQLDLEAVPMLASAQSYAAQGIRSSIWDANRAAHPDLPAGTPAEVLLFDPQTAGGLLAALPAEKLAAAQNAFDEAGEPFWVIGEVTDGPSGISLR